MISGLSKGQDLLHLMLFFVLAVLVSSTQHDWSHCCWLQELLIYTKPR